VAAAAVAARRVSRAEDDVAGSSSVAMTSRRLPPQHRGDAIIAPVLRAFLAAVLALLLLLTPAAARAQDPSPAPSEPVPEQPAAPPAPPAEPAPPAAPAEPPAFVLSEPGRLARWAYVERPVAARAEPRTDANRVARLRTLTPERTPELVLLLERREVAGKLWVRVRLPILPNDSTGWVPRSALGAYREVRTHLVVERKRLRVRLVRSGHTIFRARIGVGAPRWPTPAGEFYVRSRLTGFDTPLYGPLAFGLSARSTVLTDWPGGGFIGVHGTNQPGLIPGRPSHGCIRLRNRDVLRLGRLMPIGTPVSVR